MPYDGIITQGKEYARRRNFTPDNINWKRWSQRNFEYNNSRRYAGDGFLIRVLGKRKFYHLSTYPNDDAFNSLTESMNNPRSTSYVNSASKRCDQCGKPFRPVAEQELCTLCLVKANKDAQSRAAINSKEAKDKAKEVTLLRSKLSELNEVSNNLALKVEEFEAKANENERLYLQASQNGKTLCAEINGKNKDVLNYRNIVQQLAKINVNLDRCVATHQQLSVDLLKLKSEQATIKDLIHNCENELQSMRPKNVSIITILREQIAEDVLNFFRCAFGTTTPNRNVRHNYLEKVLREYPKKLHGLLASTGLVIEKESKHNLQFPPLSSFLSMFEDNVSSQIKALSNFGMYINEETDKVSVGHMVNYDIYDLIAQKDEIVDGEIPARYRIERETLDLWKRISKKHLASKVIEHLFAIDFLTKYKRITHARIMLIEKTYGVEMLIEVKMKSFRKIGGKMQQDKELKTWQKLTSESFV
jgi:hypothetical protein